MTELLSLHGVCCVVYTEVYTLHVQTRFTITEFSPGQILNSECDILLMLSCKNTHSNNTWKSTILFQLTAKMELDQIAICYVCTSPPKALFPPCLRPNEQQSVLLKAMIVLLFYIDLAAAFAQHIFHYFAHKTNNILVIINKKIEMAKN